MALIPKAGRPTPVAAPTTSIPGRNSRTSQPRSRCGPTSRVAHVRLRFRGPYEEGSELALVHRADELYAKTASDDFSAYKESKPESPQGRSARRRTNLSVHRDGVWALWLQPAGLPCNALDQRSAHHDPLSLSRQGLCRAQAHVPCRLPQPLVVNEQDAEDSLAPFDRQRTCTSL